MLEIIMSLALVMLGATLAEFVTGRPKGLISSLSDYPNQKMPSLFIGWGVSKIEKAYHIHHWMWAILITIILFLFDYSYYSMFFLGITLQGLTYEDRFMINVNMN
jgi:hypothetical protein